MRCHPERSLCSGEFGCRSFIKHLPWTVCFLLVMWKNFYEPQFGRVSLNILISDSVLKTKNLQRLVSLPTLLSCSNRFLHALQQNRAQSRLLHLLNRTFKGTVNTSYVCKCTERVMHALLSCIPPSQLLFFCFFIWKHITDIYFLSQILSQFWLIVSRTFVSSNSIGNHTSD